VGTKSLNGDINREKQGDAHEDQDEREGRRH
jgi:hypothetical protein